MDVNDLNVHDVKVTETNFFTGTGQVKQQTRLTFYVGTHGPFTRDFDPQQATAQAMQAAIDSQVQTLRILTAAQSGK